MRLNVLSEYDSGRKARVYGFDYTNHSPDGDPNPLVLFLGGWWHPSTGNRLFGGINLNYLSDEQKNRLRGVLPRVYEGRGNLKVRARRLRGMAPDVFELAYRTYNRDHVERVTTDMVRMMSPEAADRYLDPEDSVAPVEPQAAPEMEPEIQAPEEPTLEPGGELDISGIDALDAARDNTDSDLPDVPVSPTTPGVRPSDKSIRPEPGTDDVEPSIGGIKPTSRQRASVRREPQKLSGVPGVTNTGVVTKPESGPPEASDKGNWLSRLRDRLSGLSGAVGDFFSKWKRG